jgi:hypothetical protein
MSSYLGTTVFEGDVKIKPNVQPAIFGAGDLEVCRDVLIRGNLTVEGEQSDHQVTRMIIEDNLTGLNQPPTSAGRDTGIIMSRHIDDIVGGPVAESDTAQGGASTSITLAADSNATDDYYNDWYIKITAGPGSGEVKEITDYNGTTKVATVDSAWATSPTSSSDYELYNKLRIVAMWDESEDEFAIVGTTDDHTTNVVNVSEYCDLHVRRIIQELSQECVYYVGKHGDDADTGYHISEAKLTFGAALTAAASESPDSANQIAIICFDSCEYTENLSIPSWVHVLALNAKLSGAITLANNSSAAFREQEISSGTAVTKSSANGFAEAKINVMTLTDSANGVSNSGLNSSLKFTNKKLEVDDGVAISNSATGTGTLTAVLCNVDIIGTGTAVQVGENATSNVRASKIAGTGTALSVGGTLNSHIEAISATTAYNIASTGTNNIFVGDISGTETVAAGGTSNRIHADVLNTKGDLLTRTDTEYIRHPVGTDTYILISDSAETTGLKWVDPLTTNTAISVQEEGTNVANTPHHTLNFIGGSITATDGGSGVANITVVENNDIIVQDEGTNVANTPHSKLNFVGAGVVATDGGSGCATITISGGGGGGSNINIQEEGVNVTNTPHSTINFIGATVTATDGGAGVADVTINALGPGDRILQQAAATNLITTMSFAYIDMANMSLVTTKNADHLIYFTANMNVSNGSALIQYIINVNGADQPVTERDVRAPAANDFIPVCVVYKTGVIASGITIKIRWRKLAGPGIVRTQNRIMIIDTL